MTHPVLFPELEADKRNAEELDAAERVWAAAVSARVAAMFEAIQQFADDQGLRYDDDDRDAIDTALKHLFAALDVGFAPIAPLPVRCLNSETRHDLDDPEGRELP